jgi:hypothetical protein
MLDRFPAIECLVSTEISSLYRQQYPKRSCVLSLVALSRNDCLYDPKPNLETDEQRSRDLVTNGKTRPLEISFPVTCRSLP